MRPPASGRQPGAVSKFIGRRLVAWGRALKVLALVVLGVAGVKAYLSYHRHDHPAAIITGVVGLAVTLALASVGENLSRSGFSFLRGEKRLARTAGRLIARRRASRPPTR